MPADRRAALAVLGFLLGGALCAGPLEDGKDAFSRQDWSGSARSLTLYLNENPGGPEAPTAAFLRAVALYQQGEFRASLDGFQKLERTWPQSAYSTKLPYWKGTAALAAGQLALAERELQAQAAFPNETPFATRALLNLALARIGLGKPAPAVEALSLFASSSREPALLSQAWAAWGDVDRKSGRVTEALGHYESASAANPGDRWDLWSRTQTVDLLLGQSRHADARLALEAAVARFPADVDRWDPRRVTVARGLGDRQALLNTLEGLWSRESDPLKKQQWASNRALAAEEGGVPEVSWWLKAAAGPDVAVGAPAILRYAYHQEQAGKPADAAAALEAWVLRKNVPSATAEEIRSRAASDRWSAGDVAAAGRAWDKLLSDFPQSTRTPSWLLSRGKLRLDAGDSVKALADFSRLLKSYPRAPEAPEARYQTGLVYLKRQEPARAESWFYGLVEELGSGDLYQRALLARGISFVNAGKTDLARGSLQRLIREAPTGPWAGDAWSALGRNALQNSQFDEAAEAFFRAEELAADPAVRARALWSRAEALAARPVTAAPASAAFSRYAIDYASEPRASEALYRTGAVFLAGKSWDQALSAWEPVVARLSGASLAQTREGMAIALLRLGRIGEAWAQLELLEANQPAPEVWYRWGLVATSQGEGDWAVRAFQYLLQNHPSSSVAEAALPRAAGALLNGGRPDEALARYADYFQKFGRQPSSAPVARAAGAGALAYPATLEALVSASRTWDLAPEVAAEFSLAWAQSRLDAEAETAAAELMALAQSAPWASQRSEALNLLGRWQLSHGQWSVARTTLESAALIGDDLSVFKARWSLSKVTEGEGDLSAAARQRESAEKVAGPGVPLEFRLQVLKEAADLWAKAGKGTEATRVRKRIDSLSP